MNDDRESTPAIAPRELPIPLCLWGIFPWVPPYTGAGPAPVLIRPPPTRHLQPRIDITGERHGLLVAASYDAERGRGYWHWDCDCGGMITRTSDAVRLPDGPRDCGPECPLRKTTATP